MKLGGDAANGSEYIIEYRIRRCDKRAAKHFKIKCKTDEEIKKKYLNLHAASFIHLNLVKAKEFKNPIEKSLNYRHDIYNINTKKKQKIYFSTAEIVTDSGWFFSDISRKNFFEYDRLETSVYEVRNLSKAYVEFKLLMAHKHTHYSRSYITIPSVAANVGGLISIITSILQNLIFFYINNDYNLFLFNKLMKLEIDDEVEVNNKEYMVKEAIEMARNNVIELDLSKSTVELDYSLNIPTPFLKKSPRKSTIENINAITHGKNSNRNNKIPTQQFTQLDNTLPRIPTKEVIMNKELEKIINYKKKKREEIQIGFMEGFMLNTFGYSRAIPKGDKYKEENIRYQLLLDAVAYLDEKTDIIPLLQEIDKLNLLKKLILNESQNFMLNNKDIKVISRNKYSHYYI